MPSAWAHMYQISSALPHKILPVISMLLHAFATVRRPFMPVQSRVLQSVLCILCCPDGLSVYQTPLSDIPKGVRLMSGCCTQVRKSRWKPRSPGTASRHGCQ